MMRIPSSWCGRKKIRAAIRYPRARGFTLLEILIAMVVLSLGLTGVLMFYGVSQTRAQQAEMLTTATMLARNKMAELLLDLEKRSQIGKFPEEEESSGTFDEPAFTGFRWRVQIRKIEIPLPPADAAKGGGDGKSNPAAAAQGPMQLIMQQLKLDEAVREVTLTMTWNVRQKERSFKLTTHVVKL